MFKAIVIFLFSISSAFSQSLQLLETIDIFHLKEKYQTQVTTDYLLSNSRLIGSYWTIDFQEVISKYLENGNDDFLIQIEDTQGNLSNYSINSFCNYVNAISPQIIVDKSNYRRGDTITINDGSNINISQFADELEQQTRNITKKRIKLQITNISNDEKKFFAPNSLIFPTDKTPRRWIRNINKIKIYRINHQ